MMHIRRFSYALAAAAVTAPALVAAQLKAPDNTGLPTGDGSGVIGIITSIMNWLLVLVGILAVIAFVISGILYLTSAGDEDQAGKAKRAMISAIIGVIVSLLGLIVLQAAQKMLSATGGF